MRVVLLTLLIVNIGFIGMTFHILPPQPKRSYHMIAAECKDTGMNFVFFFFPNQPVIYLNSFRGSLSSCDLLSLHLDCEIVHYYWTPCYCNFFFFWDHS